MISIASWNCTQISNKFVLLENLAIDLEAKCIFVSETWQRGQDVDDGHPWPPGYNVEVNGWAVGRGGGVAWFALKIALSKSYSLWMVCATYQRGSSATGTQAF